MEKIPQWDQEKDIRYKKSVVKSALGYFVKLAFNSSKHPIRFSKLFFQRRNKECFIQTGQLKNSERAMQK